MFTTLLFRMAFIALKLALLAEVEGLAVHKVPNQEAAVAVVGTQKDGLVSRLARSSQLPWVRVGLAVQQGTLVCLAD